MRVYAQNGVKNLSSSYHVAQYVVISRVFNVLATDCIYVLYIYILSNFFFPFFFIILTLFCSIYLLCTSRTNKKYLYLQYMSNIGVHALAFCVLVEAGSVAANLK